jgi:hypothetical protein
MPSNGENDNPADDQSEGRSWAKGEKKKVLKRYEAMFHTNRSAMYNQATDELLQKWGYVLPLEEIPTPGVDYRPPDINSFPDDGTRAAEIQKRSIYRRKVRKVRRSSCALEYLTQLGFLQRVINWASYHYRHKLAKSDNKLMKMVVNTVRDLREDVPRKKSDLQRYQELHYEGRVKSEFDDYWKGGADKLITGKNRLREINDFSQKMWEKEDEDFVKSLREENIRMYEEDLMKYAERGKWSGTAEEYSE